MRAEAYGQGGQAKAALGVVLAPLYGWCTEGFNRADVQAARVLLHALEEEQALLLSPGVPLLLPLHLGGLFLNGVT
jgi:hypothetical protein